MSAILNLSRRDFLQHRRCSPAAGWSSACTCRSARAGRRRRSKKARPFAPNAFVRIGAGRHRHGHRQPLRDGPGPVHQRADARRRGARRRLERRSASSPRRSTAAYNHTGLRHPDDRRQHQHLERVGAAAQGRRDGARDARSPPRPQTWKRRAGDVPRRERPRHPRRVRARGSPTASWPRRPPTCKPPAERRR